MLQHPSPAAILTASILPAWAFSLLFHSCALFGLAMTFQGAPRGGAAVEPGQSAGIVLQTSSAAGELYEGEEDQQESSFAAAPEPAAELLSVLPSEAPPTNVTNSDQRPVQTVGATLASNQPATTPPASGGGQRGSQGGSSTARVTVFGVQGTGNKFVYLFDRSSSMQGAPLRAAKRQLLDSLRSLESVHRFHIIFFNTGVQSLNIDGGGRNITVATDQNKTLAAKFVDGVIADGGTDRLSALREALAFKPDVVFFLTDADDAMSPDDMRQLEQANARVKATICVIEFGRNPTASSGNFLSKIATQTGGQYGYVNTASLSR